MKYSTFCASITGMHLLDLLGLTINDDPSQYHISVVMAFDTGMLGLELAWQGPISKAELSKVKSKRPDVMWNDINPYDPTKVPAKEAEWYRSCYCCASGGITPDHHAAPPGAQGVPC